MFMPCAMRPVASTMDMAHRNAPAAFHPPQARRSVRCPTWASCRTAATGRRLEPPHNAARRARDTACAGRTARPGAQWRSVAPVLVPVLVLVQVLLKLLRQHKSLSIAEMSEITMIRTEDILSTLQSLGAIQYYEGQHVIDISNLPERWQVRLLCERGREGGRGRGREGARARGREGARARGREGAHG